MELKQIKKQLGNSYKATVLKTYQKNLKSLKNQGNNQQAITNLEILNKEILFLLNCEIDKHFDL
jgi:ribosomal protein S20